ncbi:unnamed protein product [Brassica napus]|nr:unnamed protein product [Brassica napus]
MMMGILFLSLRSCEADRRRLHRLRCSVKDYAWGKIGGWIHSCKESTRRIPMDRSIRQDRTRSFGWGLTSYLEDDADGVTLRSWIAENPEALGEMGLPSPVSLQALKRQLMSPMSTTVTSKDGARKLGVCEPVTGNVQGTELPEECDDDLLEKTK